MPKTKIILEPHQWLELHRDDYPNGSPIGPIMRAYAEYVSLIILFRNK